MNKKKPDQNSEQFFSRREEIVTFKEKVCGTRCTVHHPDFCFSTVKCNPLEWLPQRLGRVSKHWAFGLSFKDCDALNSCRDADLTGRGRVPAWGWMPSKIFY